MLDRAKRSNTSATSPAVLSNAGRQTDDGLSAHSSPSELTGVRPLLGGQNFAGIPARGVIQRQPLETGEETGEENDEEEDESGDDGDAPPRHRGVIYGSSKDRINTMFARLTNRDFRRRFNEWEQSSCVYRIAWDEKAENRLVDAIPQPRVTLEDTPDEQVDFDVKYRPFGTGDREPDDGVREDGTSDEDSDTTSDETPEESSSESESKPRKPGVHLARGWPKRRTRHGKHGWGMANRVETTKGGHVLSFGVGDYNRFNVIGGEMTGKKIHPNRGALFTYIGRSRKGRPPRFFSLGTQLKSGWNIVSTPQSRAKRRRKRRARMRARFGWIRRRQKRGTDWSRD